MAANALEWSRESICLDISLGGIGDIAAEVYRRTCRMDFSVPGFCSLNVGCSIDSVAFRRLMVELKESMAAVHEKWTRGTLVYLSAARFDQQVTTKPHLDAGPDECFLMLGYEPSVVDAELEISDYSKCAIDLGLTPQQFLQQYNPMFDTGYELLRPYTTRIPCFSSSAYQIICINNSSAPFSTDQPAWQGTLHTARVLSPDSAKRRVVNSTMVARVDLGTPEPICRQQQEEFIRTSAVRRRGYDKPDLDDDT